MASDKEYRAGVTEYGRGERSAAGLPLDDNQFWRYVTLLAARPGRQSQKEPFIGAAADSLLHSSQEPTAAAARTDALLHLLSHPSPRVRRLALAQVAESISPTALEALRAVAFGSDRELAIEAVRAIALDAGDEALAALAEILSRTSDVRATLAAEGLRRAGARSIPFLGDLIESGDWAVRWRVTACLVHIDDKAALPLLLRALHDDSVDVAWLAADGLLALGPSVREAVLRSVLHQHIGIGTARALRHYAEHSQPRRAFAEILKATQGLATLAAVPVAVDEALELMTT